jgi:hypothetical protein
VPDLNFTSSPDAAPMSKSARVVQGAVLYILIFASVTATLYLYLYPVFHGCAFPSLHAPQTAFFNTLSKHVPFLTSDIEAEAPFRLLVFADPQLEGDTSITLIKPVQLTALQRLQNHLRLDNDRLLSGLPEILSEASQALLKYLLTPVLRLRKHVDLLGNDYYLGHIYRTMLWWTRPTHVTVLGDLLGSQWLSDTEFNRRADRFWKRVFKDAKRVPDELTFHPPGRKEILGEDGAWAKRLINIAGNHDIGYAGDISPHMLERFERAFGAVNWDTEFTLPVASQAVDGMQKVQPSLRLVVLNSMNLDTPALNETIQRATYDWINGAISNFSSVEDSSTAVLLLTHLPLYKPAGVCVDGPLFTFYTHAKANALREQNHMSDTTSSMVLTSIFGFGGADKISHRPGIILNGHDHEGCDTWHGLIQNEDQKDDFSHTRFENSSAASRTGLREITQRSMMGEFGGFAGLLSATWRSDVQRWEFQYQACAAGVQHIWWAVHVLDLVVIGLVSLYALGMGKKNVKSS